MELTGTIKQVLPLQTGEGRNGPWRKQEFILQTEGPYPKDVCIAVWGNKIDGAPIQESQKVQVSFDVESREYNGRWYTDVKAWKVQAADAAAAPSPSANAASGSAPPPFPAAPPPPPMPGGGGEDDLPF